jgi:lipopolysaccharide export system protein LptA
LLGRVELKTEKAYIRCDSAWYFPEQRKVEAWGHIYIQSGEDELWTDRLAYDLKNDLCSFTGNVTIHNRKNRLFTTNGAYNLKTKTALFVKPLFIWDGQGMVRADRGSFFTERDSLRLFGNVQLRDSTLYLETDTLVSGKKSGLTQGSGNVFIENQKDFWKVWSGHFISDTLGNRSFSRQVYYVKRDSASGDTTWLAAKKLKAVEKEKKNTLFGVGNILLWHPDYSAAGDSLFYDEKNGDFQLFKNPVLWTDKRQLSAPVFLMKLKEGKLSTLRALPRPFMAEPDSASGRYNQLSADSLYVTFLNGNPERMLWMGQAQAIFHNRPEDNSESGTLWLAASVLDISFKDRKAHRMVGSKDVTGYYLEKPKKEEVPKLKGFVWTPERRPNRPSKLPSNRLNSAILDSLKNRFLSPPEKQ